jgi:hypothetical protein
MALWYRRPIETTPMALPIPVGSPQAALTEHPFHGWTESLHVSGVIRSTDRLSDALNSREPFRIDGPAITPIGSAGDASYTAPTMLFDPFDFEVVVGSQDERRSAEGRNARRIHKVRYPVLIEAGPFEIRGLIHVFPGNAPEFVSQHSGSLFFPITQATVRRGGRNVTGPAADVILVSRYTIRRITQVDAGH